MGFQGRVLKVFRGTSGGQREWEWDFGCEGKVWAFWGRR